MLNKYLTGFEYNLGLEDAISDPQSTVVRRQLACVSLDTDIQDGYYSAFEVRKAFRVLVEDHRAKVDPNDSLGSAMIEHILVGEGDDYQRRLYYLVSEVPVEQAADDLHWLTTLLEARASMFKVLRDAGVRMPVLPGRRVNTETFGCRPFGY